MKEKKAILLGASGMIGSNLLQLLIENPEFSHIKLILRKELPLTNFKITQEIIDFNNLQQFQEVMTDADVVFSAIGTTMRQVKGDKKLYRSIDFEIPLNAARFSRKNGCKQFAIVSSIGAKNHSRNFYLGLKGELEEMLMRIGFPSLYIFRPSFLEGQRDRKRIGEGIAHITMKIFSMFIPKNYESIEGNTVAKSMVKAVTLDLPDVHIFYKREMLQLLDDEVPPG